MTIDQARRRKAMARWHRRFALFIALWLVVLAFSGVLVNHAHDWGLDKTPLSTSLQRLVYGIETRGESFCETVATPGVNCGEVFARLPLATGALLLGENNLFLTDPSGQLVEKLPVSHFGLGVLKAGLPEGPRIYLRDAQITVLTDADLMDHTVLDPREADALNDRHWQVRDEAVESITWERFLLDVHAARFLGPLAKAFNDLVAALILVLAVSGTWLYRLKSKGNGNGNGNRSA